MVLHEEWEPESGHLVCDVTYVEEAANCLRYQCHGLMENPISCVLLDSIEKPTIVGRMYP